MFANGGGSYNATSYSSSLSSGARMTSSYSSSASSGSTPARLSLDLENDLPSVLQFNVGVNDIGGTLVAELAINQGRVSELVSSVTFATSLVVCACVELVCDCWEREHRITSADFYATGNFSLMLGLVSHSLNVGCRERSEL